MSGYQVWRPLLGGMRWLLVFSVAINLLALALPLHMMAIYDRVLPSGSGETLLYITLIVVAALVVLGIADGLRLMLCQRLAGRLTAHHGRRVVEGAIGNHESDAGPRELTALSAFVGSRSFASLFDLPFVPLFMVLMFALHTWLGVLTLVGIGLLALIGTGHFMLSRDTALLLSRQQAELAGFGRQVLMRRETVRALGMRSSLANRWGRFAVRAMLTADRSTQIASVSLAITRTTRQVMQVLVLSLGAWLVIDGQMSAGVIFGASIIFGRAVAPVEQLISSLERVVRARADSARLAEMQAQQAGDDEDDPIIVRAKPLGRVELRGATLRDDQGALLAQNVNMSLEPARILAIIGPARSGKSALARMIAGGVVPSEGTVRLDGHDPSRWPDERRARTLGYVGQDAQLFPGSIADNIARFDPGLDEERVLWAARFAGAHEMIAALPDGYGTIVGLDSRLGHGQRQLVALARALYLRPRLLVLDEPNAHLDQRGEAHLLRALANARHEGIGSVVISQRRAILQIADYIATLNEGRLTAFEENRGQWKRRAGDERRRDAVHEKARTEAVQATTAISLADQLSRSLGVEVRPE